MKIVKEAGKVVLKMSKVELDKMAKKEVNPWAICHSKIDKDKNPEKFERCVMDIKKKHNID